MRRAAGIELLVEVLQLRGEEAPVVEHLLQAARDAGRIMRRAQVAGNDDQLAVAGTIFVGGEFHGAQTLLSPQRAGTLPDTNYEWLN